MKKIVWSIVTFTLAAILSACGGQTIPAPTITGISITSDSSISSGASQFVFAEVSGTGAYDKGVTWTASNGTLSKTTGSSVRFKAPTVTTNTNVTLTAKSTADTSKSEQIIIEVIPVAVNSSVTAVTVTSDFATVNAASPAVLTSTVTGTNGFSLAVNWSIVSGSGTLSTVTGSPVTFTAPSLTTSSTTIIRATSVQDSSKSGVITITNNPVAAGSSVTNVSLTTTPSTPLNATATTSIAATVTGTGSIGTGVIWSIVSGSGTISAATGATTTFTAPSLTTSSSTIIRATSIQDPSKSGDVTININAVVPPASSITAVSVSASRVAMRETESSTLFASVAGTGAFSNSVTWAIENGGVGKLSSSTGNTVFYQAPPSSFGRVVRITATSVQDLSQKSTIFVSVNPMKASIAGGTGHSLAIKSDGTLLSWGEDSNGQLGDDEPLVNKSTPVAISDTKNIVAIAAGYTHSLALQSDGTLLSWGRDNDGQLGDDTAPADKHTPVSVSTANNIIAIAAGGNTSFALKSNGTLLSWGSDIIGQLGDDSTIANKPTPVAVSGANNIIAIAAGGLFALALKSDGTLLSWGQDTNGQLGDDSTIANKPTPVPVSGASDVISIAAGSDFSLAIKSDGTLLSWGSDTEGKLGDDATIANKPTPVTVRGANSIVAIAASGNFSLALKSDGTLLSWGSDFFGELGDDTASASKPTPVPVSNANNIVAIAAGSIHSLALKSDGTLLSWGGNNRGQIGNGTTGFSTPTPVSVLLGTFTIRLP